MTKKDRLRMNYELVCDQYISLFVEKHGYEFTGWVAGEVGGLAEFIEQYFFNFQEIVYDIDHNCNKNQIFEWQDACLERQFAKQGEVSFRNFVKYGLTPFKE